MRTTGKQKVLGAVGGAAVTAVLAVIAALGLRRMFAEGSHGRRLVRARSERAASRARYVLGRSAGLDYRLAGRQPDPNVTDSELADRICSSLGPVEARLDIPHVHVSVYQHVAVLYGDVGSLDDAREVEEAVAAMSGVARVDSRLRIGLGVGMTRPSEGRRRVPVSNLLRALRGDVASCGVPKNQADDVIGVALHAFVARLPVGEARHLEAHLPQDLIRLIGGPRREWEATSELASIHEFSDRLAASTEIDPARAEAVIRSIVRTVRIAVPEESDDIAAVLPDGLRTLWLATA